MSPCSTSPVKRFMSLDQATGTPLALTFMEAISFIIILMCSYVLFLTYLTFGYSRIWKS